MVPRCFAYVSGKRGPRVATIFDDSSVKALDPDPVTCEMKPVIPRQEVLKRDAWLFCFDLRRRPQMAGIAFQGQKAAVKVERNGNRLCAIPTLQSTVRVDREFKKVVHRDSPPKL